MFVILTIMVAQTELTYPEFNPGSGGEPPYLAGRATEQKALLKPLERLRKGKGYGSDIIVVGPRGNGKTALLRWFEGHCEEEDDLDVVWLTPDEFQSVDDLTGLLAPREGWKKFLPDGVEFTPLGLGNLKWQLGGETRMLTHLLTERCSKGEEGKPLVVLLDEAHTLDLEFGRVLLNTSQKVRAKAPFLLVLAGTPGLEQRLGDMGATFWTRSERLGIGRLDAAGSRKAIIEPFATHRIQVDEDIVRKVVIDSQGYPHFLQCWGQALTERLREAEAGDNPVRRIDSSLLEQARPKFLQMQLDHYEDARRQIKEAGLQSLAAAVTRAAQAGTGALTEGRLNAVIQSYLYSAGKLPPGPIEQGRSIAAFQNDLAATGYIWKPPIAVAMAEAGVDDPEHVTYTWLAGIPSLMTHVLQKEEELKAEAVRKDWLAPTESSGSGEPPTPTPVAPLHDLQEELDRDRNER